MSQPRLPQAQDLFTGVFIPRAILEDARLTGAARILFGCLDGLGRTERGCYAGSGYLSRIVGVKPRQIRNLLTTLERCGYITRIALPRGGRILKTVTAQALQNAKRGAAMDCRGGRQWIATDIIRDIDNPPNPPNRGAKRKRNRVALEGEDYARGF